MQMILKYIIQLDMDMRTHWAFNWNLSQQIESSRTYKEKVRKKPEYIGGGGVESLSALVSV